MMAFAIAGREFRTLFLSPLAWAVLGFIQVILGFMFLAQLDYYLMVEPRIAAMPEAPGVTDLIVAPLFGNAGLILMLGSPLLTMRLISEERRNKTLTLLFTAPVSMTEIILGKYLGVFAFFLVTALMFLLMPLSLLIGGGLDIGKLAACFLGLVLALGAYAAAGLYVSTLTENPAVAAISTFSLLLFFWIIDWSRSWQTKLIGSVFDVQYLSLQNHYESLLKGLVSTTDLVYFLLFIATFLVLSVHRLDNDRLQK